MVAGGELPVRRADLPHGQPAAACAADARARQAATARPLGHDAWTELHLRASQPRDHGARPGHDVRDGARSRRTRPRGGGVAGGDLQRGVRRRPTGRGRDAPAVHPVLLSGRHPQPRRPGDARIDPRGRRARLLLGPRLRRGVRQPRPDRRCGGGRWRSRDRPARRELALDEVRRSPSRRRRSSDPAPQRLQDRQPDGARAHRSRRAGRVASRVRPHAPLRGGRRSGPDAPRFRRRARPLPGRDRRHPAPRASRRRQRAAPLADAGAAVTEGLDRARRGRWPPGRGLLAITPGAVRRRARRRGPPQGAGGVAAQLPPRGALRRDGRPRAGHP